MLKRYDLMIVQDRIDAIQGQYVYLVSDVSATMIERPDAEAVAKHVFIRPCAIEGWPDAHTVRFKVDPQEFEIGDGFETREEAEFMMQMFVKALLRLMGVEVKP